MNSSTDKKKSLNTGPSDGRVFAGGQALMTLYLVAIWILSAFGHNFD
jgi:hypothetical protein